MEMSLFLKQITAVKPTKAQMNIKTFCHAKALKIPHKIKSKKLVRLFFISRSFCFLFVLLSPQISKEKSPKST